MANRREVLIGGGTGLAAVNIGLASQPVSAAIQPSPQTSAAPAPALFLVDTVLSGAQAAIAVAEHRNIPVVRFAGDVGTAWLSDLEPLLRASRVPIAGLTYGGGYFCVKQLVRKFGLTSAHRMAPPSSDPSVLSDATHLMLERASLTRGDLTSLDEFAPGEATDKALLWVLQPAE